MKSRSVRNTLSTAFAAKALRYTASTDLDPRRDRYRLHRRPSLGGTESHLLLPAGQSASANQARSRKNARDNRVWRHNITQSAPLAAAQRGVSVADEIAHLEAYRATPRRHAPRVADPSERG